MAVTYKDIDELSQKSSVAGTEKLPVSDTQYITPAQITGNCVSEKEVVQLTGGLAPFVKLPYSLTTSGAYGTNNTYFHAAIRVVAGEKYVITNHQEASAATFYTRYAFATSASYASGANIALVSGTSVEVVPGEQSELVTIPNGCNFLLVSYIETGAYYYDVVKEGEGLVNEEYYNYSKMSPTSTTSGYYFTYGGNKGTAGSFELRRYDVTAGRHYAFNARQSTSYAFFFVSWADSEDNIFCVEPWRGSPFVAETTIEIMQEIIAPPGAVYAYCNVQTSVAATEIHAFFEGTQVDAKETLSFIDSVVASSGYQKLPYGISTSGTGKFGASEQYWHAAFPVVPGEKYVITNTQTQNATWTRYAFVTSLSCESGGDIPFVTGTTDAAIALNSSVTVTIPAGCSYLIISQSYAIYAPISVRRDTSVSFPVSDVTVGGTSVVSNGVAAVPAIPTVPTISTDISADASSNTKTASPNAVKTYVDGKIVYCATETDYTSITTKDSGTLYVIPVSSS